MNGQKIRFNSKELSYLRKKSLKVNEYHTGSLNKDKTLWERVKSIEKNIINEYKNGHPLESPQKRKGWGKKIHHYFRTFLSELRCVNNIT